MSGFKGRSHDFSNIKQCGIQKWYLDVLITHDEIDKNKMGNN